VEVVVAVGDGATRVIATFCRISGAQPPLLDVRAGDDEVLVWMRGSGTAPRRVKPKAPHQVHKRHTRKYAEGSLGEDRSFYFRGPDDALNLRAQNLVLFIQISGGVDDLTWMHHLRRGDYSAWFRHVIKDHELATEAAEIETDHTLGPADSGQRIADAVTRRYTAPA
jgi:hypothetical protein